MSGRSLGQAARSAVIAVAGILIAVLALVGVNKLGEVSRNLSGITEKQWEKVEQGAELLAIVNENMRLSFEAAMGGDPDRVNALLDKQEQNRRRADVLIDELGSAIESDEERALFEAATEARAEYAASFVRLRTPAKEGRVDDAHMLLMTDVLPKVGAAVETWGRYAEYQREQMTKAAKNSEQAGKVARYVLIAMAIIALVAALILTVVLHGEGGDAAAE